MFVITRAIEEINDAEALLIAYDNDKDSIEFIIKDYHKIDLKGSIKRLKVINTKISNIWSCKLEIIEKIGWDKYFMGPEIWIDEIKNNLKIVKKRGANIYLTYKNYLDIAYITLLPEPIAHIIKEINKFDKNEIIAATKSKAIDIWLSDSSSDALKYFFNPIIKFFDDENVVEINIGDYERALEIRIFNNDGISEMAEDAIKNKLIPMINNKDIKIKIILSSFSMGKSFCKFKDLIKRKSLKTFLALMEKTDIPTAIATTDMQFDDIEFVLDSSYAYDDIQKSVKKAGQQYLKYYINDLINQINENKFYGLEFDNNYNITKINIKTFLGFENEWKNGFKFLENKSKKGGNYEKQKQ
jgi:hypothetical protein